MGPQNNMYLSAPEFAMIIDRLAKVAGVMHEADHAYSIQSS